MRLRHPSALHSNERVRVFAGLSQKQRKITVMSYNSLCVIDFCFLLISGCGIRSERVDVFANNFRPFFVLQIKRGNCPQ